MKLEGPERRDLREILLAAFNRSGLKSALGEASPSREFENLVTPGPFKDQVFELIDCAERQGWLDQLLVLLEEEAPGRDDLIGRVRGILERARKRRDAGDPVAADPIAPDPGPDDSHIGPRVRRLLEQGTPREVTRQWRTIAKTGTFAEARAITLVMIKIAGSDDRALAAKGYETLGDLYANRDRRREAKRHWSKSLVHYRRLKNHDKIAKLERKLDI